MLQFIFTVWSISCLSDAAEELSSCPFGWTGYSYGNRCFKKIEEPLNWSDALENCNRISGKLAQFPDELHNDSVIKLNFTSPDKNMSPFEHGSSDVWIGASRDSDGVHYKWLDGRTVSEGQFTTIDPPHCLALSTEYENGFVGLPCEKRLYSLCEREVVSSMRQVYSGHECAKEKAEIHALIAVIAVLTVAVISLLCVLLQRVMTKKCRTCTSHAYEYVDNFLPRNVRNVQNRTWSAYPNIRFNTDSGAVSTLNRAESNVYETVNTLPKKQSETWYRCPTTSTGGYIPMTNTGGYIPMSTTCSATEKYSSNDVTENICFDARNEVHVAVDVHKEADLHHKPAPCGASATVDIEAVKTASGCQQDLITLELEPRILKGEENLNTESTNVTIDPTIQNSTLAEDQTCLEMNESENEATISNPGNSRDKCDCEKLHTNETVDGKHSLMHIDSSRYKPLVIYNKAYINLQRSNLP